VPDTEQLKHAGVSLLRLGGPYCGGIAKQHTQQHKSQPCHGATTLVSAGAAGSGWMHRPWPGKVTFQGGEQEAYIFGSRTDEFGVSAGDYCRKNNAGSTGGLQCRVTDCSTQCLELAGEWSRHRPQASLTFAPAAPPHCVAQVEPP
jgi:hypothetical protein